MSDDLIDRARAALDGVTPESWHPEYCEASNVWHIDAGAYPIGTEICKCKSDANARFIAAARSLVPDMADEIARLRSEMASGSFYQEKDIDAMQDEITRLRAEVDRLREAERTAWEPPPEAARRDGFECLGQNSYNIWRHIQWSKRNGWTVRGSFDHITPIAFAHLPGDQP